MLLAESIGLEVADQSEPEREMRKRERLDGPGRIAVDEHRVVAAADQERIGPELRSATNDTCRCSPMRARFDARIRFARKLSSAGRISGRDSRIDDTVLCAINVTSPRRARGR